MRLVTLFLSRKMMKISNMLYVKLGRLCAALILYLVIYLVFSVVFHSSREKKGSSIKCCTIFEFGKTVTLEKSFRQNI